MSFEVRNLSLADICCDVSYGYTESATSAAVGPKFLRITDIQGGTLDWREVPYCPATDANVKKYGLEIGDIVIARTGNSTGENTQLTAEPPSAVFASYLIRFRPDASRVNPFFVGYQLRTERFRQYVLSVRSGSAQPGANAKQLGAFTVELIDRALQDDAVEILRAIDERIALLRETNTTLEAIAQALFKSWFVDFDPVRAKAEGLEPQAMNAPTAALFPDSFEESELGLVPKGWQVGPVGDFVQVVDYVANGSFASLKENVTLLDSPSFALYVRTTDYNSGFSGGFRYVDKQAYDFLSKSSLKGNEVLISNVGDVGTVFRAPSWLGMPMTLGSNAVALKAPELSGFLFFYFKGEKGQHDIQSVITGSAQLKFNKTSFRSLRIAIPEVSVLQRFESIAGEILTKIDNNLAQVKALTQLRDTLLPRLISGQLRLPEAQAWVAEVG